MSTAGADFDSESSSRAESSPTTATPSKRVKFMCSYGGRFLPRPADGHLKYVGGDTRLVCIPRHITFLELMRKLTSIFNDEMILKYHLPEQDLEDLITVRSDEDTRQMIYQCDLQDFLSAPYVRAFLISTNPIVIHNQLLSMDYNSSLEKRYIYAVNGINLHPTPTHNTIHTTFTISTACSSSRTPPETTTATATCSTTIPEVTVFHGNLTKLKLPRSHSSPSLSNLGHQNQVNNQQPPQPHHFHPQQPPKPPLIHHPHGSENLGWMRSTDAWDHATSHNPRTNKGWHMGFQRSSPFDKGDSSSV